MQQNFWEQGNLMRVNFREHLNLFLGNKGKTAFFSMEQGNMYPPPPPPPLGGPPMSAGEFAERGGKTVQCGRFLCSNHEYNTQHSYGCLAALSV